MTTERQNGAPHGAKAAEVYGIAGYLFSIIFYVLYLLWACTPDWVLHSISITYYPSRYWAIALPSYALSLLLYLIALYNAWNMVCTNPFESYYTFRDTISEPPAAKEQALHGVRAQHSIPPAADIPITHVNRVLFSSSPAS
mmetsp:Transcript_20583/g.49126  ORF Transcript_20583/g.49126 Transcript_20583/m.49126 type:complete len:141 (-) Transcript_20583:276-698(-)|eukprot:CAMPEP_0177705990 /NCGR_PEP_ID=MMETSP0484_2-20121128/8990_1 /TAXON_ID=354590 /ORGANISM="Rhodomonas lens, Strain RHODO" /LENGTH=140 /DNA_ID=CAMNT_0019217429 /DNA_START=41 /DNA_END=463 /DNA_ORIENTATION=+